MLKVGLTGGVASGKSTVARALAARGAALRDADEIVRELYAPGAQGSHVLAASFGPQILDNQGGVNKRALGAMAFAEPEVRRQLEMLIHPLVRQELKRWYERLCDTAPYSPIAVVEAALLVETGHWSDYDRVVVVIAPVELRRARALAAGWSKAAFDGALCAQASDEVRVAVANYVINNDADHERLELRIDELWSHLAADAAAKTG
jgi:dephospho-CoA kinase